MADRDLRIRMLLEAADRVTKPLKDIAGGSSRAATALKATRDRLREIERTQGEVDGFRKLKAGLASTTRAMEAAKTRATELGRQMAAAESPTRALTREFARAKRETEQLTEQHQRETRELTTMRERLRAAGVETAALARHERELRRQAADTTRSLEQQASRLERLQSRSRRFGAARERFGKGQELAGNLAAGGAAAIAAGVGTGAAVWSVAKDAMSMEDVMADVRKVVNFDDQARSIENMRGQIIALSTVMPMTAEGLGQIVAAAGRSGIAESALGDAIARNGGRQLAAAAADRTRAQALVDFAQDAAKMGIAFDMTADEAGTMMATWRTAFNADRAGVRVLGDQVNALTNTFGGNVTAVTAMVTRIGGLGKVAGASSGSIAALAQLMAKLGIEDEVGATSIKNLLLALTRGAAVTPKMGKAFKQLGLDAKTVSKAMQRDANGTILDVFHRIAKLGAAARPAVLTQLFGKESVAGIAQLLTNLPQLEKNFKLVGNAAAYTGSMENEYVSRSKTTSNAVQLATNNFTALKITVGTMVLPTIVALAARVGRVMTAFRNFAAAHPTLTKALVVGAAAVAALLVVMGALGISLAAVVGPFAAVAAVATYFEIGMLPVIGIAAAVVVGIAALAATIYLLYANWGHLGQWFGQLWEGVKGVFAGVVAWFAAFPARFAELGRHLVQGLIDGITGRLAALKNAVTGAASAAATWFKEKLGIHSPSRVFHEFGGFMMDGLTNGIAGGEDGPVRRLDRLSRRVQSAIATGAAIGAVAAPAGAATRGRPAAAAPAHGPITIHVHAAKGQDEHAIGKAVAKALAAEQARQAAAARSSYADTQDWE